METTCYEIRVRGRLSKTLLDAFPGLHAQMQGAETVLAGALPDQAALYGALTQIEALGLELLEVRRSQAQELRRSQAQEHGQNAPTARVTSTTNRMVRQRSAARANHGTT